MLLLRRGGRFWIAIIVASGSVLRRDFPDWWRSERIRGHGNLDNRAWAAGTWSVNGSPRAVLFSFRFDLLNDMRKHDFKMASSNSAVIGRVDRPCFPMRRCGMGMGMERTDAL